MEFNFTLDNIDEVASEIWQIGKDFKIWAFYGDMGAGKTTFINSLCSVLHITSTFGSPTYSIINEYSSPVADTIFHMDWYRLSGEEEALQAGVEEALYSNQLCLVEWPERAVNMLPPNSLHLYIKMESSGSRTISLQMP